jgi:hypothetical protein
VVLWDRKPRARPSGGASYVGRRDASGVAVYFVASSHISRLVDARGLLAWGDEAQTEPLAAVMLRHHTGRRQPPHRQLGTLGMWLQAQPEDGFVLESAELARIVGAPLMGRRRLRSRSRADAPHPLT